MNLACTDAFRRDFSKLPTEIRKKAGKQITQLLIDHRHPSLRLEGIQGRRGLFSVRVDRRYRMSLSFEEDQILLRRLLDHDDLYRAP